MFSNASFSKFATFKIIKEECTVEGVTPGGDAKDSSNTLREVHGTSSCEPINDKNEVQHYEYTTYPASSTDFTQAENEGRKRKASERSDQGNKRGYQSNPGSRGGSSAKSIGSKGRSSIASTNLMSKDWKRSDSSVSLRDCEILSHAAESDDRSRPDLISEITLEKDC